MPSPASALNWTEVGRQVQDILIVGVSAEPVLELPPAKVDRSLHAGQAEVQRAMVLAEKFDRTAGWRPGVYIILGLFVRGRGSLCPKLFLRGWVTLMVRFEGWTRGESEWLDRQVALFEQEIQAAPPGNRAQVLLCKAR